MPALDFFFLTVILRAVSLYEMKILFFFSPKCEYNATKCEYAFITIYFANSTGWAIQQTNLQDKRCALQKGNDGKNVAIFSKMNSVTLTGWFMQYANMFKVLAPESFKNNIINELKSAVKHYKWLFPVSSKWGYRNFFLIIIINLVKYRYSISAGIVILHGYCPVNKDTAP